MCNEALAQNARTEASSKQRAFDLMKTVVQIANLLRPTAPEGFEIRIVAHGSFVVSADPQDVFRILFNLMHNAIAVARQGGRMTHLTVLVERAGGTVTVRVADDGPGLPKAVRANLFRASGVRSRRQRHRPVDRPRTRRTQWRHAATRPVGARRDLRA